MLIALTRYERRGEKVLVNVEDISSVSRVRQYTVLRMRNSDCIDVEETVEEIARRAGSAAGTRTA